MAPASPASASAQVADLYMQGKMSTLDLIDRYSQAHCWRASLPVTARSASSAC